MLTTHDPIACHLRRTARALRTSPLRCSEAVIDRRLALLSALEAYASAGRFPKNHDRPDGRKGPPVPGGFPHGPRSSPVFIDRDGAACAVGELLRASGEHRLALQIAREIHGTVDPAFASCAVAAAQSARLFPTGCPPLPLLIDL